MGKGFLSLNRYLKALYGQRVQKIPLDSGLGCPNRDGTRGTGGCIYCDPLGSGTGRSKQGLSIKEQMRLGVQWAKRRYKARLFIAYFQSYTNTYGPLYKLRQMYEEAMVSDDVVGLFVGTRPDCIDVEIIKMLKDVSEERLLWVELGLQSANNETLERINRGHTVADFERAVGLLKEYGIPVCAHVIFGLPGEDRDDMLNTVDLLKKLHIDGVKFHQLYVLEGTPLAGMFRAYAMPLLSMEEYCGLVAESIKILPDDTVIHRLQGDPPPTRRLLGPDWSKKKSEIRERILRLLEIH